MDTDYSSLLKQLDVSGDVPGAKALFIAARVRQHQHDQQYINTLVGKLLLDGRVSVSELSALGAHRQPGLHAGRRRRPCYCPATHCSHAAFTVTVVVQPVVV